MLSDRGRISLKAGTFAGRCVSDRTDDGGVADGGVQVSDRRCFLGTGHLELTHGGVGSVHGLTAKWPTNEDNERLIEVKGLLVRLCDPELVTTNAPVERDALE